MAQAAITVAATVQVLHLPEIHLDSAPSLTAAAVPGTAASSASTGFLLSFPLSAGPAVSSGEIIPDQSAGWLLGLELLQALLVFQVDTAHRCELAFEPVQLVDLR